MGATQFIPFTEKLPRPLDPSGSDGMYPRWDNASGAFVMTAVSGSGTVTSVALSLPGIFSVSGSPITTNGTLSAALANQSANLVFAGPGTGSAAAPTFRALAAADIPTLTLAKISDAGTMAGQNTGTYYTASATDTLLTGKQPLDGELTAIAGLTSAANKLPRFTGSGTADLLDFSTSTSLAANSDTTVPSQHAVKAYVDNAVTGLLDFKGATDASGNPNYPAASKGDCYVVSVAGKIGGASGKSVDVADLYLATADNAGGTEASVGASWSVLEHNLVGALLASNNLSELSATAATARSNIGAAAASALASYLPLAGGTMSGDLNLNGHSLTHAGEIDAAATDPANVPVTITGAMSQVSDLFECREFGGTPLMSINATGGLNAPAVNLPDGDVQAMLDDRLPLAGGTMGGDIDLGGYDLPSVGIVSAERVRDAISSLGTTSGTINADCNAISEVWATVNGSFTLANPTNSSNGDTLVYRITQDATGGRAITWGSNFRHKDGSTPTLSTASNSTTYIGCQYDSTAGKWDVFPPAGVYG